MSWISDRYLRLTKLYPPRFKQRFGEEMPAVFCSALADARHRGLLALAGFYLKEFISLPASIAAEYIHDINSGEGSLSLQPTASSPGSSDVTLGPGKPSSSWSEAFLAGLPHLLVGIPMGLTQVLIALGMLSVDSDVNQATTLLTIGIIILVSLAATGYAWRKHWPVWSASWTLVWIFLFVGLFNMVGSVIASGNGSLNLADMPWPMIIPLGTAYLLYRFARRDKLRGVLAALPVMLLIWSAYLERTPMWINPEGWIGSAYLTAWIPAGLAAMVIIRTNRWRTAVILALAVSVLSGLFHSYIGIYHGGILPFTEPGPSLKAVLYAFYPIFILSTAILAGPQLARQICRLGQLCGMKGRIAYRAALLGMLMILTAIVLELAVMSSGLNIRFSFRHIEAGLGVGGMVLYATAFAYLILTAIQTGKVVPTAWLWLLFWLPLGIPIALVIGVPVYFFHLPQAVHLTLTLLAIAWIPIVIWEILSDPLSPAKRALT